MTDTNAPQPWAGWSLLQTLAPYLGQATILLVTAAIAAVGTLWSSGWFSPPPPLPKVEVVKTVAITAGPTIADIRGDIQKLSADISGLRKEIADRAAAKAAKRKP